MKSSRTWLALVLLLIVAAPAFGQCQSSPENPTIVLAGLASGAYGVSQLFNRVKAQRASKRRS